MTRHVLYILGAGGHGKVVGDCARSEGRWAEIIYLDDRWPILDACEAWKVVGAGLTLIDEPLQAAEFSSNRSAFVAIGHAETRLRLLRRLKQKNIKIASVKHPAAVVSLGTIYDFGTIFVAGSVVNIGTRLGMGCIVNTGATVDHDCILGDGVHVCPGANLGGNVQVGEGSWIGIGSSVRQGIKIGAGVTIGAGAAVVTDVADGMTMVGVPARPIR